MHDGQQLGATGQGPEPAYTRITRGFRKFEYQRPFHCAIQEGNPNNGVLPQFHLAYETWGKLNADKSNAILLHTGLSASSHARSHSVCHNCPQNPFSSGIWF